MLSAVIVLLRLALLALAALITSLDGSAGHPNQTATQTKSLLARSESHTWSERVPYSVNTALQLAIECMYACTTGSHKRLHFYTVSVCETTPHKTPSLPDESTVCCPLRSKRTKRVEV